MALPHIVSEEVMRQWLGLSTRADDAIICGNIAAAQTAIENRTGLKFADYFDEETKTYVDIPAPLILATKMLAAHWYENRELVLTGDRMVALPWNAIDLIEPYCEVVI
jgi:hypothetical protein